MVSKTKDNDQDTLPDGDLDERDFDLNLLEFKSHILATQSRVIPLKTSLTIPRSELSGLLLCLRLMSRAVTLYNGGFSSASCMGDSTCIISALEKNATAFNPFMHTRLSEICNFREKIPMRTYSEDVFHVASLENIAEICTRRESNLMEIGFDSAWQSSPSSLKKPYFN